MLISLLVFTLTFVVKASNFPIINLDICNACFDDGSLYVCEGDSDDIDASSHPQALWCCTSDDGSDPACGTRCNKDVHPGMTESKACIYPDEGCGGTITIDADDGED